MEAKDEQDAMPPPPPQSPPTWTKNQNWNIGSGQINQITLSRYAADTRIRTGSHTITFKQHSFGGVLMPSLWYLLNVCVCSWFVAHILRNLQMSRSLALRWTIFSFFFFFIIRNRTHPVHVISRRQKSFVSLRPYLCSLHLLSILIWWRSFHFIRFICPNERIRSKLKSERFFFSAFSFLRLPLFSVSFSFWWCNWMVYRWPLYHIIVSSLCEYFFTFSVGFDPFCSYFDCNFSLLLFLLFPFSFAFASNF